MLFFGKQKTEKIDLQKVNEEIYKHNADLANKNRTLSLLYKLYDIATHISGVDEVVLALSSTITTSLRFPFFGVIVRERGAEDMLQPILAVGLKQGNLQTFFQSSTKENKQQNTAAFHAIVKEFFAIDRSDRVSSQSVDTMFLMRGSEIFGQVYQELFFYTFPLIVNKETIGFIVIGIDKSFASLHEQEQELIENIKNVVAISMDNALIYTNLLTANTQLQELDRQKTEFLSIASHQLRTPLSIIKGYVELLNDGAYGKVTQKMAQIFHNMDISNERLVKLVDEFLDVSRIEQGRTRYTFELVDLNERIENIINELTLLAKEKKIDIHWKKDTSLYPVVCDGEKMHHVLYNFIDNAIKYTPEGSVDITTEHSDAGVAVRVTDTGIGFSASDDGKFFHKFYRGNNIRGKAIDGTGLGIYVARQFVEAHGGRVWAKSPGEGQGSEFGFWIPRTPVPRTEGTNNSPLGIESIMNQYGN